MNQRSTPRIRMVAGLLLAAWPEAARACATCFGRSDSKLAEGMNVGIFSLLLVVVCVLVGIAAFFIYLARRSATLAAVSSQKSLAPDQQRSHHYD